MPLADCEADVQVFIMREVARPAALPTITEIEVSILILHKSIQCVAESPHTRYGSAHAAPNDADRAILNLPLLWSVGLSSCNQSNLVTARFSASSRGAAS
mmetsp:Transcript_41485/g.88495  ORF Transcript_41485/g.88495 Transcript_41485/m.88495 type:complete len:100 (-) Transcript_41485:317-616(-)